LKHVGRESLDLQHGSLLAGKSVHRQDPGCTS
jgi:hypothetical protein